MPLRQTQPRFGFRLGATVQRYMQSDAKLIQRDETHPAMAAVSMIAPGGSALPYSAASAMSSAVPKWLNMPVKRLRSGGR